MKKRETIRWPASPDLGEAKLSFLDCECVRWGDPPCRVACLY